MRKEKLSIFAFLKGFFITLPFIWGFWHLTEGKTEIGILGMPIYHDLLIGTLFCLIALSFLVIESCCREVEFCMPLVFSLGMTLLCFNTLYVFCVSIRAFVNPHLSELMAYRIPYYTACGTIISLVLGMLFTFTSSGKEKSNGVKTKMPIETIK